LRNQSGWKGASYPPGLVLLLDVQLYDGSAARGEYEHGRLPPKARTGRPSANRGCVGGRIVRGDARVG
jgi:hypothetical protein